MLQFEIKADLAAIEKLVESEISAYNLLDGYDSPTMDLQEVLQEYGINTNNNGV